MIMLKKYRLVIGIGLFLLFLGMLFITVKSTVPKRWNEQLVGLSRENVHLILGYPDANFMPKGWEGWSQGTVIGAWVLTIGYNGDEKVIRVTRKFDWGFDYYGWANDWKKFLVK